MLSSKSAFLYLFADTSHFFILPTRETWEPISFINASLITYDYLTDTDVACLLQPPADPTVSRTNKYNSTNAWLQQHELSRHERFVYFISIDLLTFRRQINSPIATSSPKSDDARHGSAKSWPWHTWRRGGQVQGGRGDLDHRGYERTPPREGSTATDTRTLHTSDPAHC